MVGWINEVFFFLKWLQAGGGFKIILNHRTPKGTLCLVHLQRPFILWNQNIVSANKQHNLPLLSYYKDREQDLGTEFACSSHVLPVLACHT